MKLKIMKTFRKKTLDLRKIFWIIQIANLNMFVEKSKEINSKDGLANVSYFKYKYYSHL